MGALDRLTGAGQQKHQGSPAQQLTYTLEGLRVLLLPFDAFTFETTDALEKLLERMRSYVGPPGLLQSGDSFLKAEVRNDGFKLNKTWGRGKGSMTLVTWGRFRATPNGRTQVSVGIRLGGRDLSFFIAYFGFVGVFFVVGLGVLSGVTIALSLFMWMVAWALMLSLFRSKASECRTSLTTVIAGTSPSV